VKNRLSGVFTRVHANVEPGHGLIRLSDAHSLCFEYGVNCIALGLVQVEVVRDVTLRY
jgi:hypothetical protein